MIKKTDKTTVTSFTLLPFIESSQKLKIYNQSHLILTTVLRGTYYFLFINEGTEAQKVNFLKVTKQI